LDAVYPLSMYTHT